MGHFFHSKKTRLMKVERKNDLLISFIIHSFEDVESLAFLCSSKFIQYCLRIFDLNLFLSLIVPKYLDLLFDDGIEEIDTCGKAVSQAILWIGYFVLLISSYQLGPVVSARNLIKNIGKSLVKACQVHPHVKYIFISFATFFGQSFSEMNIFPKIIEIMGARKKKNFSNHAMLSILEVLVRQILDANFLMQKFDVLMEILENCNHDESVQIITHLRKINGNILAGIPLDIGTKEQSSSDRVKKRPTRPRLLSSANSDSIILSGDGSLDCIEEYFGMPDEPSKFSWDVEGNAMNRTKSSGNFSSKNEKDLTKGKKSRKGAKEKVNWRSFMDTLSCDNGIQFNGLKLKSFSSHVGQVNCIKLDESTRIFVTGGKDRTLKIFSMDFHRDIETETIVSMPKYTLSNHRKSILDIEMSDGVGYSSDRNLLVWNLEHGKSLHMREFDCSLTRLRVSKARNILVSVTDSPMGLLKLFDTRTFNEVCSLKTKSQRGDLSRITDISISEDCNQVAVVYSNGALSFLDLRTGGVTEKGFSDVKKVFDFIIHSLITWDATITLHGTLMTLLHCIKKDQRLM